MATVAQPAGNPLAQALRDVRQLAEDKYSIWSWIATVDHKRIGVMYGVTAFIFFLLGGAEALLLRLQLSSPNATVLDPDQFNRLFTMHGTTMVFLVVMPLSAAFFNLLVPLMIGARDVAFPRLNSFSFWAFLGAGIFLNASFFIRGNIFNGDLGAPDGGWFGYSPLTSNEFSPGNGIDFWILGLLMLGVASLAGGFNFVVTILNMRAPGMTMLRMPLFVWMTLVTSLLIVFAMPVITVALFELLFDRLYNANFFNTEMGGSPLLWQHMFWLFGHPEVYILILPAMGIVSEILPTFSKKPLFGYPFVVFSGVAIGFMSWGVWVHHMYTTGLGTIATSAFGISTLLIGVPTGVKIFNWLGTMWGGSISLKAPLMFSAGFITMFTIGGLSGILHSMVPSDFQQQDTYFVVAHFHYVLFGGAIFALFAGAYYWFSKFTGKMLHDGLGQLHFWIMFIGFNLTFFPMHMSGLLGMPRRVYTYQEGLGFDIWNLLSTVGGFLIAASMLVFIFNVIYSLRKSEKADRDPWDGRTLEWSLPSPVPHYNFKEIPVVESRDAFWNEKYKEDEAGVVIPVVAGASDDEEEHDGHGIHMPSPSFFPLIAAAGLPVLATGLIYDPALVAVGAATTMIGVFGWAIEPATEGE